ncbi:MAG TPA: maleylpyruvate isomerase [Desulfobacteraceae bacterium]|nr:maleylpyruvate isomerase [Desulfobacteraceae bacterium]
MAALTGEQLAHNIREGINALKEVCAGVDEKKASRAPEGRWSPREILSHLLGPEGEGHLSLLQAFLDHETPRLDMEAENPFFTGRRAAMTFTQLLERVENEYNRIAAFAAGLSAAQLDRRAHVPMLKGSGFGEYPTLEAFIGLLGGMEGSHLHFHTDHLRKILRELSGAEK